MTLAALRFRPLSVTAILQAMAAHTNRLAQETSPYLLQHQHNPVDWYPWGEAAFARARAEDRPILLSIGYSACHWCHVMERESFEDEQTAAIMNEHFVNVKVDREERPDVDSIYMTAVQRITGQGGWPMTVFITPEGEPFYGGTYFPPEPRHGMPSFRQLLLGISQAWRERRVEVHRSADELTSMLREAASLRSAPTTLEAHLLDRAATDLVGRHDADFGGFGAAPKFPQPLALGFLLRHWQRTGTQQSLDVVRHTLRCMARGGVYDHVGGGFHRYSVDAKWLVPHFEKMLYDNALLARVYLDAYTATKEEEFGQVATEVLDYVRREMTSPEGGFFSAQDADSEGEEGRFYVWTPDEIDRVLGEERGKAIRSAYGVSMGGNFERRSILNLLPGEGVDPRGDRNAEVAAARARMREARQALYATREGRVRPGLDDKVLTGWNAMMLRSFAEAGMRLGRTDYVEAARRNAGFLRAHLWQEGGLLRTRRAGISKIGAFLDDHALLVDALVSLYHATLEPEWIELATTLCDTMLERFWSPAEGVFYDASDDGEGLVVRPREMNDSATASGSSAACTALLRMSALTGMARYAEPAIMVLEAHAEMAARFPQAFGEHLSAMDLQVGGIDEVAVVGEEGAADTEALLEVVRSRFLPRTVFAFRPTGTDSTEAVRRIPLLAGREAMGGAATAYVCRAFACRRPVTSPSALARDLGLPEDG